MKMMKNINSIFLIAFANLSENFHQNSSRSFHSFALVSAEIRSNRSASELCNIIKFLCFWNFPFLADFHSIFANSPPLLFVRNQSFFVNDST